jgi:fucose permease
MLSLPADRPARNAGAGFLLAGMLMGVLGSLMIVWRYQLDRDPRGIGLHFFAFDAAILLSGLSSQLAISRLSLKSLSICSCLVACAAFVELSFVPPPIHSAWRIGGVALLGFSAGGLLTALIHFVRPYYERHAVSTINLCGSMFGLGSLLVTVALGSIGQLESVQWKIIALAVVPLILLGFIANIPFRQTHSAPAQASERRNTLKDLNSVPAILFSLLLFFQFGNEWALAGWLPLFLVRRLGLSPGAAISTLALYFLSLVAGRLLAQLVRRKISHAKLLFSSVTVAMLGYLLVSLTESATGAALATVVIGLGFAPVYGLVAEKIGRRFDYEPGFFNSIFSLAITGAMLVPWLLGFVAYYFGMQYVLVVPALGSVAVLVLMLLITLEAKLMSDNDERSSDSAGQPKAIATSAGKKE